MIQSTLIDPLYLQCVGDSVDIGRVLLGGQYLLTPDAL